MRLSALAAALLLATSGPAFAGTIDALADAFGRLPATVLANPAPDQAYFLDVTALAALSGGRLGPKDMLRTHFAAVLRPVEALRMGGRASWEDRSGLPLDQVRYFVGYGSPPRMVSIWGLADDDAAQTLLDALAARDFEPAGESGVLGNGPPLAPDLSKRDPFDPWRGAIGSAAFTAADGDAVIQAAEPEIAAAWLTRQPSAADHPIIATALAGLDEALGDGQIVQALLISPAFGLGQAVPADLFLPPDGDLEALRDTLEASMAEGAKGIPPYFGGIVADLQGENPAIALSLSYPDCPTAARAADLIAGRWADTMPETAQGQANTLTAPGPDGLCAATVTIVADGGNALANPLIDAFYAAYTRRQFTVLQIGTE